MKASYWLVISGSLCLGLIALITIHHALIVAYGFYEIYACVGETCGLGALIMIPVAIGLLIINVIVWLMNITFIFYFENFRLLAEKKMNRQLLAEASSQDEE